MTAIRILVIRAARRFRDDRWTQLSMAATVLVVFVVAIGQSIGAVPRPIDFGVYWRAQDLASLYGARWGADADSWYVYPPPLAIVMVPVRVLGFGVASLIWVTALGACLAYVARGWSLVVVVVGFAVLAIGEPALDPLARPLGSVLTGNVQMLLVACVVAGIRAPALWSIPILTKLSPAIGLVWFAVRGDWRSVALISGVVGCITAATLILAPEAWSDWFAFMHSNVGEPIPIPLLLPGPFALRAAFGVVVIAWAARTNRPWVVPIAIALATIGAYASATLSMLLGVIALHDQFRNQGSARVTISRSSADARASAGGVR